MTVPRFWRKLKHRYNLLGTHCTTCDTYYYPPRKICPKCRRVGEIKSHQFKGRGKLLTYTIIYTPPEKVTAQTPYVLGIVELDEGPRLTSQIICRPEEAEIGMRVRSVFRKIGEESAQGMIYYGTKFVKN